MRRFAAPLFFVLVTAGILVASWRILLTEGMYKHLADAPQGQAEGPADARAVIVEFMDYRCKPCRLVYPVVQEVARRHPEIRIVFRHFPVYQAQSVKEARIALAAGMQGKFMAMHDLLIKRDDPVEDKDMDQLCKEAGIDCKQLQVDMMNPAVTASLQLTLGIARVLHIHSDPLFVINRHFYSTHDGMPTADDFDRLLPQKPQQKG